MLFNTNQTIATKKSESNRKEILLSKSKPKNEMDNVDMTFFRTVRKIKKGAYVYIYMNNQQDAALPQLK